MIRPVTRFLVHALAALVGVLAIVFVVGAWRLSTGPISLAFLTPYLQEALVRSESPYRIEVDDTILTWVAEKRALDIRILGLRALGAEGTVVANVPVVSLRLSVPALFRGLVAPTSFAVIAPRLTLIRDEEGRIALGLGEKAEATSYLVELLIADLLASPGSGRPMDYLERIRVVGAELDVEDRLLGLSWQARQADIVLAREGEGLRVEAMLDVTFEEQTVHVDVTALYEGPARDVAVDLSFAEFEPARLAALSPDFASLSNLRLPVSGTLGVVLTADGTPSAVAFHLRGGAGRILVPGPLEAEIPVSGAEARGRFMPGLGELTLDQLTFDLGGSRLTLEGRVSNLESEPVLVGEARLDDLPLARLSELWPPGLVPVTRAWVVRNLTDGVVRAAEARFELDLATLRDGRPPPGAITATLLLENVTVNFLDPLPKARGVDGRIVVSGDSLKVVMPRGTLAGLALSDGSFTITGLGSQDQASVAFTVRGEVSDAMDFLADPFLGYPQKFGVDPAQAAGRHETRVELSFPLLRELKTREVQVLAYSRLMDASLQGVFDLYDVSRGDLDLRLDNAGMDVIGTLAVNGVAGRFTWRENFDGGAPFRRRITFYSRVNDAQWAALKMPGDEFLTGPVVLDIEATSEGDGGQKWAFVFDVGDAFFRLPALLWSKEPGVQGLVRLEARRTPTEAVELTRLDVAAGDLVLTATGELDPAPWALRRLDITRLAFGLTDVRATVVKTADGGYEVDLEGQSLDLRTYLESARSKESTPLPPLRLTARLDRLITRADQVLKHVTAGARYRDGRWEAVSLEARLPTGKKVVFEIAPVGKKRALRLTAEDAGQTMRAFDIFDNANGGRLEITGMIDDELPERPMRGQLVIEDFTLEKTPMLARILSLGSFTGVLNLLKGEGVPFTRLEAPFTRRDRVIEIEKARAFGPALGITFEGRLDLAADSAELKGTLVPAYTLNSILGNIPVIGNLLVGTEGSGVFAATYRVTGSIADPTVTVNPLATLAPGFLRGLFGFVGGMSADEGGAESTSRVKPREQP